MGKFNIGDTVECIQEPPEGHYQIKVGETFVIQKIEPWIDDKEKDTLYPDRNKFSCYKADLFKLAQSVQYKTLIKGNQ